MLQLLLGEYLVFLCQPFDYFNVQALGHYELSLPRGFSVAASLVYRLQERQVVFQSALVVVFTEGRSSVNDTCSVFCTYIIHAGYEESLPVRLAERHELFVFHILKILALHLLKHFVIVCSQSLVCQSLGNVEYIALFLPCSHFHFNVIHIRTHSQ